MARLQPDANIIEKIGADQVATAAIMAETPVIVPNHLTEVLIATEN